MLHLNHIYQKNKSLVVSVLCIGLAKKFFWVFPYKMVWKKLSELFGQPSIFAYIRI